MLGKEGGLFYIRCDVCGERTDELFYDFNEVAEYKRENGWKSRRVNGQWEEICPDCVEEEIKNENY